MERKKKINTSPKNTSTTNTKLTHKIFNNKKVLILNVNTEKQIQKI